MCVLCAGRQLKALMHKQDDGESDFEEEGDDTTGEVKMDISSSSNKPVGKGILGACD